jgi:hypothetical protein
LTGCCVKVEGFDAWMARFDTKSPGVNLDQLFNDVIEGLDLA